MTLQDLYRTVHERRRPEDVAEMCRQILAGQLSFAQAAVLEKAAQGALERASGTAYTSMAQKFATPIGLQGQLATAGRLFPNIAPLSPDEASQPPLVLDYVRRLNVALSKTFSLHDFKYDRLSHAIRREKGLDASRRQYNKMFRHVAHMEGKLATLQREWHKYEFARIGKTRLVTRLSSDEFVREARTACFIAYYAARCNLRSEFTNTSQQRPFDEISEMLLELCRQSPTTNWWAIAHIYPLPEVLAHLNETQKGYLLSAWVDVLSDIAELLNEVWNASTFEAATMIVQKGNDSTTWNNTAAAWNKARDGWFATIEALDMEDVFADFCPGKVPRLMAADVAYWHRVSGSKLHPDTAIWAELPFPWQVLRGEVACSRVQVEEVCRKHGVDPQKTAWTQGRRQGKPVNFRPTPELVHGVTVGHPVLAKLFRDAGFFSGKNKNSASQEITLN